MNMKLIAIIATAAMAVGLYTAAEASTISEAKHEVICQQNGMWRPCSICKGTGMLPGGGATPCAACRGFGKVR